MNSLASSSAPRADATSRATIPQVSLFRLYTLRACYLMMSAGLAVYVWPVVLHHTPELAIAKGVQVALLAGLGATAALGLVGST